MGAPKQKWTSDEEDALRAGVDKHGAGKWRTIQKDPEFSQWLSARSNVDLKDKWRNMSVSAGGQGSREKPRIPKVKGVPSLPYSSSPTTSAPLAQDVVPLAVIEPSKSLQDGKAPQLRYNSMIIEALSAMRDPHGCDINSIACFIEERNEIPPNFRRVLTAKLRRLVAQEKIEKIQSNYKLKNPSSSIKTSFQRQPDQLNRHGPPQSFPGNHVNGVEEAAAYAACRIAEAEYRFELANESANEAAWISKLAEESDALLLLAKNLYSQCRTDFKWTSAFVSSSTNGFSVFIKL
ncbi:hypothetical protein AMTRI_Chr05g69050 [Amborella trichopoda]